jgi:hypothetical protein
MVTAPTFPAHRLAGGRGAIHGVGTNRTGSADKVRQLLRERIVDPSWFTYFERFEGGKPLITGDITVTSETTNALANRNLEILGTNHTSADVEWLEGGGVRIETAGAASDAITIEAHQLGAGVDGITSLLNCNWDSANELLYYASIVTGPDAADIVDSIIWGGWKLTNTPVVATDADQAYFRFGDDATGNWQCITSVNGTDETFDTGIAVQATTAYELLVVLDSGRSPHYYIASGGNNFVYVHRGAALRALNTFDFVTGIGEPAGGAGAAVELDVRNFIVSQLYG